MTKAIGLIILSCLMTSVSLGQDRFYLKNGSKLKGRYVSYLSTDSTMFIDMGLNVVHVPYNLLSYARFSKLSRREGAKKELVVKYAIPVERGYFSRVGAGILLGNHDPYDLSLEAPTISFQTVNGYRWSNLLNVSGKLGLDFYSQFVSIPLAVHYEYTFRQRRWSPIIMTGIGYGFVWNNGNENTSFDSIRGGMHYYFEWGYRFKIDKRDFIVKIGGQRQSLVQEIKDPDDPNFYWSVSKQKRVIRRISVGMAYTF